MNPVKQWKQLQDESFLYRAVKFDQEESYWSRYACNYDIRRRSGKGQDQILQTIIGLIGSAESVLEIGAGTGAYTIHMADKVERVTVIEPSPSMISILQKNLGNSKINNVRIDKCRWQEAEVTPHDVVLAAGCIYVFYDIENAIKKMLAASCEKLILTAGINLDSSIYEEAAGWLGVTSPSAGPDFVDLYNVLCYMGIYANVHVFNTVRSIIYDDFLHAVNVFAERLKLPNDQMDRLRSYLTGKLAPLPTGELTLGERLGTTAVIWYDRANSMCTKTDWIQ